MRTCSIAGCGRPVKSRGWCNTHYQRYLRTGDPLAVKGPGGRPEAPCDAVCSVPGCQTLVKDGPGAHGMCQKHYRRWYETGEVELRPPPKCQIPGCSDPHDSNGMCARHRMSQRTYGDPLGRGTPRGSVAKEETRLRYEAATPLIRADLRMAHQMRVLGRRRDVDFYLARAETHGRPLTKLEREFADGVRMEADRERDQAVLSADVVELTKKGLGAKEIGRLVGVSDRTVVRHRQETGVEQ